MTEFYWTVLDIAPTQDQTDILKAYARRLRVFRPDVDPEGFQRLAAARDAALAWAETAAEIKPQTAEEAKESVEPRPERDNHLTASEQEIRSDTASDTVLDTIESAATKSTQRELEELVLERLADIMRPARGRMLTGIDVWDVRTWNDLFNQAAALSLQSHRLFHDTIGRYFVNFLPSGQTRSLEGLLDFADGRGVPAVIEAIEHECRFAEQPKRLASLCNQNLAMLYFSWLADAQSGRAVLNRRSTGKLAYVDQTSGIPIFPPDDRLAALGSHKLMAFHDLATKRGRWPWRFDWAALFVPAEKLVVAGWAWWALALLGATALVGFMGLNARTPAQLMTVLSGIFILLALRVVTAIYVTRLAVRYSVKRVIAADKMLFWHQRERSSGIANRRLKAARALRLVEIAAILLLIAPVALNLWTSWQLRNDLDRPVEAVVSETVVSAFEGVADNDPIPVNDLFEFVASVREAEAKGFDWRGDGMPGIVRNLRDRSWLAGLKASRDRILGKSLLNAQQDMPQERISETEAMERQRKLHAIADAYRTATPAQRIQIELVFSSWRPLLNAARGPQAAAAIWAGIPPRISSPDLAIFAKEMRKDLLDRFLLGAVANNEPTETNQLIAKLHWLLTVPDDAFRSMQLTERLAIKKKGDGAVNPVNSMFQPVFNPLQQAFQSSGYTDAQVGPSYFNAMDYFRTVIGREQPHFANSSLSWSDFMLARKSYFHVAQACLDMSDEQTRMKMRQIIIQSLIAAPAEFSTTSVEFWQNSTLSLLAEPQCYRRTSSVEQAMREYTDYTETNRTQYRQAASDLNALSSTLPNNEAVLMAKMLINSNPEYKLTDKFDSFERDDLLNAAHTLLGRDAYIAGDYRNAILHFDLALRAVRSCSSTYARRGLALDAIGEHKRAVADYHAAFDEGQHCDTTELTELRKVIGSY